MDGRIRTDWRTCVALAAATSLALSTQFLFQRSLYRDWDGAEIAAAWVMELVHLALVAASMMVAGHLAALIPRARAFRAPLLLTALAAGAFVAEWSLLYVQWGAPASSLEGVLVQALRWVPVGAVCAAIVSLRSRAREHEARLHRVEVDRMQLERQAVASEIRALQAQVEPHFLFNTLATIRRLHEVDPVRGRETLAGFLRYLQLALPAMRSRIVPLAGEVGLVVAYLDVLRVRMGKRLNVEVDVPAGLGGLAVPPLSIATLVENAVKHGLADLPEGGTVSVRARIEGPDLVLVVADTGVGLVKPAGSGSGLANLRMRLQGLYEGAASLQLATNVPRGLRATVRLPRASLEVVAHA
ncbi:MAG TPA: histidine kinase [Usitatibacter sp.]|nr:histidine kinase [Usitatibacter sp.]